MLNILIRNLKNKNLKPSTMNPEPERGQVMLITSLVLSGALLGATAIAGLLTLYQLRQGSDMANSTKAIFAADAGLEWRLYRFFKTDKSCDCSSPDQCPEPEFSNGATLKTSCVSEAAKTTQAVTIRSTGIANKNARAFEFNFTSGK